MQNLLKIISLIKLEMLIWISAIGFLLLINPYNQDHHSLCFFKNLGIEFCPGCGLGRSISLIFRGDLSGSFQMHPLGIPVLAMILMRVTKLIRDLKRRLYMKTGGWNG